MGRRKDWRNCVTHHVSKQRWDCAMSKLTRVVELQKLLEACQHV
jgi:hypothetical protein